MRESGTEIMYPFGALVKYSKSDFSVSTVARL